MQHLPSSKIPNAAMALMFSKGDRHTWHFACCIGLYTSLEETS